MLKHSQITLAILIQIVGLSASSLLIDQDSSAVTVTIMQLKGPTLEDVRLIRSGELWVVEMGDGSKRQVAAKDIKSVFEGEVEVSRFFPELVAAKRRASDLIIADLRKPNLPKMLIGGAVGAVIGGYSSLLILGGAGVYVAGGTFRTGWITSAIVLGFVSGEGAGVVSMLPPGVSQEDKKMIFVVSTGTNFINFFLGTLPSPLRLNALTGIISSAVVPYYYYKAKIE